MTSKVSQDGPDSKCVFFFFVVNALFADYLQHQAPIVLTLAPVLLFFKHGLILTCV